MEESTMTKRNEEVKNIDEVTAEEIEGYDYCTTKKQKCLNDCAGSPMLSTLD